ncbi:hypothetical protein LXA43DRAFT_1162301 [Ganoderma leucocontextum]|nr:hypothetical protein LXA43DRAFT_1162301 [Ganoderma leucocontextum]
MTTKADEEPIPILPKLAERPPTATSLPTKYRIVLELFHKTNSVDLHDSAGVPSLCPLCYLSRPFSPMTWHASLPSTVILKLYDRCCLSNVREEWDDDDRDPWTRNTSTSSTSTILSPRPRRARRKDFDNPMFLWANEVSDGEFESYLQRLAQKVFDSEHTTSERLRALQGKKIPRLVYGVVDYEIAIPNGARGDGSAVTETVPGLLS